MLRGDRHRVWPGPGFSRRRAILAVAVAFALSALPAPCALPAGDGPSYRIFLTDGTPLVSYGEYARASGRVVFTVPIGSPSSPDALQVVTLPDSAVDWDRTERYTDAVRHQQYASTRGEQDYAALTGAVARALGDMAFASDPGAKLAIAADIRRQLLEWPAAHLGYRSADVRELTAHVEEAISDIRAGSGQRAFDLSLVAMIEPPSERLLPEPTLKDALDSAAAIAQMTETRRERVSLQQSILTVLEQRKPLVPRAWYTATRKALVRSLERERTLDGAYADLTSRTLRQAREQEADGDVAGLERLSMEAEKADSRLGHERPEMMTALLKSLADSTEKARAYRRALAQYEQRKSAFKAYRHGIDDTLGGFDDVSGAIAAVRDLATLGAKRASKAAKRVSLVEISLLPLVPPVELRSAHDLLVSSARLMREALKPHLGTAAPGDAAVARNASAAAAGGLLLLDTARRRIDEFFRRPSSP